MSINRDTVALYSRNLLQIVRRGREEGYTKAKEFKLNTSILRVAVTLNLPSKYVDVEGAWWAMTAMEALESIRRSIFDENAITFSQELIDTNRRLERRFEAAWLMIKRLLFAIELSRKPMSASRCQVVCNTLFSVSTYHDQRYIVALKHFNWNAFTLAFAPLIYEAEEHQSLELDKLGFDGDM
jgi:hypothetical protein